MKTDTDQPKAPEAKANPSTEPKPNALDAKTDAVSATKPHAKTGAKPKAKPDPKEDLKTLPLAEVEKKLESSPDGLTQAEAQKRLTQYGPNELTEKKTNLFLKFLSYFWGPIPWMAAEKAEATAKHGLSFAELSRIEAGHLERLLTGEIQWAMQRMFQQYDSIAESLLPTALIPEPKLPPQREWKIERPQPQLNFGE